MKKMAVSFLACFLCILLCFNMVSCRNREEEQVERDALAYAQCVSTTICLALRDGKLNEFPLRDSGGLKLINKCVTDYLRAEATIDGDNRRDSLPQFSSVFPVRHIKSGFLKSDTEKRKFVFVVLWRQSEADLWKMASNEMTVEGLTIERKIIKTINDNWLDENLLLFPVK